MAKRYNYFPKERKTEMSLIATAKAKAAKGSVSAAFKNEAGAIDLASIMVGIIVIGLIGGVIAATVFAVIPWAQDNAAKQQLDSVSAAQSAFIGLSSDPTTAAGGTGTNIQFGTMATSGSQSLSAAGLLPASTKVKIGVQGTGTDAHYIAIAKSSSGKLFYITDTKTQATEANGTGGNASTSQLGGTGTAATNITAGASIGGVTWGVAGTTPVTVPLTGSF